MRRRCSSYGRQTVPSFTATTQNPRDENNFTLWSACHQAPGVETPPEGAALSKSGADVPVAAREWRNAFETGLWPSESQHTHTLGCYNVIGHFLRQVASANTAHKTHMCSLPNELYISRHNLSSGIYSQEMSHSLTALGIFVHAGNWIIASCALSWEFFTTDPQRRSRLHLMDSLPLELTPHRRWHAWRMQD